MTHKKMNKHPLGKKTTSRTPSPSPRPSPSPGKVVTATTTTTTRTPRSGSTNTSLPLSLSSSSNNSNMFEPQSASRMTSCYTALQDILSGNTNTGYKKSSSNNNNSRDGASPSPEQQQQQQCRYCRSISVPSRALTPPPTAFTSITLSPSSSSSLCAWKRWRKRARDAAFQYLPQETLVAYAQIAAGTADEDDNHDDEMVDNNNSSNGEVGEVAGEQKESRNGILSTEEGQNTPQSRLFIHSEVGRKKLRPEEEWFAALLLTRAKRAVDNVERRCTTLVHQNLQGMT